MSEFDGWRHIILTCMENEDYSGAQIAVDALADKIDTEDDKARIIDELCDLAELGFVRDVSSRIIGIFEARREIDALKKLSKGNDVEVRIAALVSLVKLGEAHVDDIISYLDDFNPYVRLTAAQGIIDAEKAKPGSVDLAKVKERLEQMVRKWGKKEGGNAVTTYLAISRTIARHKKRIDMPGEVLQAKPKPPKGMFRRRVAHA